jgi:hypothetical protein
VRAAEAVLAKDPSRDDARLLLGWSRYRTGEFEAAAVIFEHLLATRPNDDDARLGAAYCDLQTGRENRAALRFLDVLARRPEDADAWAGLGIAARRPGVTTSTIGAARTRVGARLAERPDDRDVRGLWLALERRSGGAGERRARRDAPATRPLIVDFRAGRNRLEVRTSDGGWSPVFVMGVNLGAARPGRFPTQFPEDEATYATWLSAIAGLGANAVRTYTLLPPAFYRALAAFNADRQRPLWLLQGVWTELPPRHDFFDEGYLREFHDEIARVIDAVHGDLLLAPRPGHAHGDYDTDASPWTLGWIVGREWEPFAVVDFLARYPGEERWTGSWFDVRGSAMERWVARSLEFTQAYEARRHRASRPVSFANWPTLDPLHHPTEATRAEEDRWRAHHGVPFPETLAHTPWEDDRVTLDATKIRPTATNPAGLFASYHIYPNFPDFLNLDPGYGTGRDAVGPSRYAAYLADLAAYHGDQPVLVAEFGMSTSRGIAHVQPRGWHHGGHDEREAGALVGRMLHAIHDTGYAGGVVFAFMDEWFKGTWSTAPWELPGERRRMWFSAESPEQSYGLWAYRPARAGIRIDGDPSEWPVESVLASAEESAGDLALRDVAATSDEGYLYLRLRTAGGELDLDRIGYRIALDTLDPGVGATTLPAPGSVDVPTGVEFLIDIFDEASSRIRVVEGYEPFAGRDGGPLRPPAAGAHPFVPLTFETNRERFARDGTRHPAIEIDRGRLRFGSLDPSSPAFDTRADVAVDPGRGVLEVRVPWGLLNVADPSRRRVLVRDDPGATAFSTEEVDGFRLYAFAVDRAGPGRPPRSRLPADGSPARWTWPPWEEPTWTFEEKHGVSSVRRAMETIRAREEEGSGDGR